MMPAGRRNMMA